MSEIDEMQRRIMAALDRIGQGLDGMVVAAEDNATQEDETAPEDLRQLLDDEKLANAQLEERVKHLRAKLLEAEEASAHTDPPAKPEEAAINAPETLKELDARIQSLRAANDKLRENNRALREANAAGLADADLVKRSMEAELDALRAAQAMDRAEADTVLAELNGVLGDAGETSQAEGS
ncbi:hypothetical protein DQW77_08955 [Roseovarius sp. TE539]|uniref:hypothetical protein n=1 Tax=Roseovarius sp. TE539 TaxID=2249812 RepID=UPI000DDC3F6E|nr:hypothetical protein [Roseovarius sp. TE539]RBI73518.1 hypothetical protein DQW77_08955 [Roseovarius sp. TE539]